jgi:hypothetical protein
MQEGENSIVWDGADASGNETANGMYFARIGDDRGAQIIKLLKTK